MDKLTITYRGKNPVEIKRFTTFEEAAELFHDYKKEKNLLITLKLNNLPVNLNSEIFINGDLTPIYFDSAEGKRIYRKTLSFILFKSCETIFPEKKLVIGQSMEDGVYYSFIDDEPLTIKQIASIEAEMLRLIAADRPIVEKKLGYNEAIKYFEIQKRQSARHLLSFKNSPIVTLYECDGYMDSCEPVLTHSTAKLKQFALHHYAPGFLLRIPNDMKIVDLPPFKDNTPLFNIHNEYRSWGKVLEISSAGELNQLIQEKSLKDFINVNESLHDNKIANIARVIYEQRDATKIVLIAGPSSSGKTTFTKKLVTHLKVYGFKPCMISMDDYFLPKDQTPRDSEGKHDFESIRAIDVELLNKQLVSLFKGDKVELPVFDFKAQRKKETGHPLQLDKNSLLVMEGIHGLNEELTPLISREEKFMIYVSALTQLKLDNHNRIPTTDNRLLRRMVRDYQFRGQPASGTFDMWSSVRRGEDNNIFPFQSNADIAFNSALDYEIAVLKVYAEPILKTIKPESIHYGEAIRILHFLDNFLPIPTNDVPPYSILREFVGGSGFKY